MSSTTQANGIHSPLNDKAALGSTTPRIVIAGKTGRILCVADIRGDYHELNRLIREHEATAVIHTGDFGFINVESLDRMGDKILRHLLTYSPLIPAGVRTQLLSLPWNGKEARIALHDALNNSSIHFPLSQFPLLLSGAIHFPVPVFTVWGLIEDVKILERFRTGEYEVHNLSVLDEVATRSLDVGGLQLRLFGLGGAVVSHRLFDNGEGHATIAGGTGTMWTTALQIGELVDTAQRVYDERETRLFVSSAPISRNGMLSQLANALKADLTISGGLHFRYPASFNEFSVHGNFQSYRNKLIEARDEFADLYASVKEKVDVSLNELQQSLLKKAIEMTQNIPPPEAEGSPDGTWTNTWHWVLSDASCGHLLFSVSDGRVSAETKSSGLNFSHRIAQMPAPPSAPLTPAAPPTQIVRRPSVLDSAPNTKPAFQPVVRANIPPSGPGVPPRPPTAAAPGQMNNIRGIATRPPQHATRPPAPSGAPPGPSSGAPVQNTAQSSIPPKPPTQPRQSRGGGSLAGQALAAVGVTKDKPATTEPTTSDATASTPSSIKANAPSSGKPAAPNVGKPATPAASKPATSSGPAKPVAPTGPGKSGTSLTNGKSSPAQTPAPEKTAAAAEKRAADSADKKPADSPKKRATDAADRKSGPAPNGVTTNGEKSSSTPAPEDPADKGHSRDGSMSEAKHASPKKHSLYVKGIPTPTSQDELKALFKTSDKIMNVKIISDHMSGKQKNFAYVDFANEEGMQEALKSHTGTIRETEVNVSVSNPPSRFFNEPFRGRGRGSFRGRGGTRGGFGGGAKKEGGEAPGGSEKKDSAPAAAVTAGGGDK